jgi:hypothetical protein
VVDYSRFMEYREKNAVICVRIIPMPPFEDGRTILVVFPQGNCVDHHMFGSQVFQTVKGEFFPPTTHVHDSTFGSSGEMFDIAMTKSLDDEGVVGSTSDI